MKTRFAVLCIAVVSAAVLPQSFAAVSARQPEVALWFDHVPALNATPREGLLTPVRPFANVTSTVLVGSNNTLCRFDLKTKTTSDPIQLFSSPFDGPTNLAGAFITGTGNDNILILGGPAGPSSNPLSGFLLGPPLERLGAIMQVPGANQFGHQVVFGNFMGDATLEMAVATNRGGPGGIEVWEPQTDRSGRFYPFRESYSDGVQLAAADTNGDGIDELHVYQTRGREFRSFQFRSVSEPPTLVGFGDPFGPDFFGGGSVTGFDVNNDGRDELIFAPGPGRAPLIRVFDFDPAGPRLVTQFMAGDETMTEGTSIKVGLFEGKLNFGAILLGKAGLTNAQIERFVDWQFDTFVFKSKVYDANPFGSQTGMFLLFLTGGFDQ